ncbi:hypothetical protein EVAR_85496_1 [Eumeta japonica]|uniref:Regulatory protein zeste n=1 Tax=Eumeta variegata TaxID=151549 RepID=A0A4C1VAT1_EUMVA|nr:hypothetical protein EVAR_85496_1 [Eumeta japonica]
MTKEEVMQLVNLVEANPVLFSKATNASNNQLKEATWLKITNIFNSMVGISPRKPEQLRLKWENLKKTARKRSTKIRMNNLKTGGGKPEYIPPDEALEKVAAILGATCDGYTVPFGGDAQVEVTETVLDEGLVVDSAVVIPFDTDTEKLIPISPSPTTPQNRKFFFSSTNSKGKLKRQTVADDLKASVIARNRAIAEYYNNKMKHEEVIAALKKKKLELEILQLKKNMCLDESEDNVNKM